MYTCTCTCTINVHVCVCCVYDYITLLSFTARHSHKSDSSRTKHLRSSDEQYIREDESTSEHSLTSSLTKEDSSPLRNNEPDSNSNSNAPISDDSTGQAASGPVSTRKSVAIDMSQNECFTRRLLPAVSSEFDNVMDQVTLMHSTFVSSTTVALVCIYMYFIIHCTCTCTCMYIYA